MSCGELRLTKFGSGLQLPWIWFKYVSSSLHLGSASEWCLWLLIITELIGRFSMSVNVKEFGMMWECGVDSLICRDDPWYGGVVLPNNDEVEVYSGSVQVLSEFKTVLLHCHWYHFEKDIEAHPAVSVSQVQLQNNTGLILSFNVSQNEGEIWNNLEAMKVQPGVHHVTYTT